MKWFCFFFVCSLPAFDCHVICFRVIWIMWQMMIEQRWCDTVEKLTLQLHDFSPIFSYTWTELYWMNYFNIWIPKKNWLAIQFLYFDNHNEKLKTTSNRINNLDANCCLIRLFVIYYHFEIYLFWLTGMSFCWEESNSSM